MHKTNPHSWRTIGWLGAVQCRPPTNRQDRPGTPVDATCIARHTSVGLLAVLALAGCTPVPAWKQQQVSKPNMVFDDTNAFAFSARLLPQCEPGTAVNGSSPGGGCTACR